MAENTIPPDTVYHTPHMPGRSAIEGADSSLEEVRAAGRRLRLRPHRNLYVSKVAGCGTILAAGLTLTLLPQLWARILGTFVVGCMFAHAAELQHEALHGLGFRRKWLNVAVGTVLGLPMLISFAAYRAAHLRHHRDLGTPQNREYFDYNTAIGQARGDKSRLTMTMRWLMRFSMIHHYGRFIADILRAVCGRGIGDEKESVSRRIRRDHLMIMAAFLIVTALSLVFGRPFTIWQWLVPLLLVAGPVHAFIELPEHYRCDTFDPNPFRNTRSIRSGRFMYWFTNGNNFHVEHHLMPGLPIGLLGSLHLEVRGRMKYLHPTYTDFLRSLARAPGESAASNVDRSRVTETHRPNGGVPHES